jgi:nucleotide-binding universal stress UspA family protein
MLKSLLLHLDGGERDAVHLEVAARLAREHGAHLDAVFTELEPDMPVGVLGRGASAVYLEDAADAAERAAALSEQRFLAAAPALLAGLPSAGWSRERGEAAEILARRSRTADLAILGQGEDAAALVEAVLDDAGCPLLVVPRRGAVERVGARALVAWDASAPASRALRGALPLLMRAEQVVTLVIGDDETLRDRVPPVQRYLERHGAPAVPDTMGSETSVGPAILGRAVKLGCDLVVMGAYGHSRLMELLLGGTTRHVLHNMTAPVLLAH